MKPSLTQKLELLERVYSDKDAEIMPMDFCMAVHVIRDLQNRIGRAQGFLAAMIDGGEECRGRDSEISEVIRILGTTTTEPTDE